MKQDAIFSDSMSLRRLEPKIFSRKQDFQCLQSRVESSNTDHAATLKIRSQFPSLPYFTNPSPRSQSMAEEKPATVRATSSSL